MPKLNKLLANLPFNPSLIGQISFYSKRLKRETSIRRLGFIMLALAMFVQLFAFMSPPQPSLAKSPNDLIYGGFTDQGQAVQHCLNPNEDYHTILAYYGISCQDLDYGHASVVNIYQDDFNGQLYSMGRDQQGFASEQRVNIPGANNGNDLFIRYLWEWHSTQPYKALYLIMHGQKFFILFDCGNLVSEGVPTPPPAATPAPAPAPTPTPQPQPPADQTPAGAFDVANCTKIAGWAFDSDLPSKAITVRLYVDGNGDSDMTANQYRPDVGQAIPGAGDYHGFYMAMPSWLKTNTTHTLRIYALGIDKNGNRNNNNPLIGTKVISLGTCQPNTPPPPPTPSSAVCSSLQAGSLGNRKYNFIATTSGTNYTVSSYSFDFGDTTNQTITTGLYAISTTHTYAKAGSYTAKVTIQARTDRVAILHCQVPITITETPPSKPCEEFQSSDNLEVCLRAHKTAINATRGGGDANGKTAHAGDVIVYNLTDTNVGKVTVPNYVARESITDVLDYADVTDFHGGHIDKYKIVSWPAVDVKAGETVKHQLTVKIKNPIPNTPASSSDPLHFDHRMTNVYGDTVVINLPGNIVTLTQSVNRQLVNTGPGTSLIAIVGLTIIVGYFFARSRLLSEEVDIVRSDYAATGGL